MNKLGTRRLLKLAAILDKADALHKKRDEDPYNQQLYVNDCGSPGCALGHWAFANKKRWFYRPRAPRIYQTRLKKGSSGYGYFDAEKEFSISFLERDELFAGLGCGKAKTAKDAAKYIRKFVAKRAT